MANLKTSQLPAASALTGAELVEAVQGGDNVQTTSQGIANLATKASVGLGNADNTSDVNKPVSTAQAAALSSHTTNTSNPHSVTKAQVGLGNVDNTADLDKPVPSSVLERYADALLIGSTFTEFNANANGSTSPPIWTFDIRGADNDGTYTIMANVIKLVGGIEHRPFDPELVFNNDHDLYTVTGGERSFTIFSSITNIIHNNGIGVVARLNTPASVAFSADFLLVPGSDAIDTTKMNLITFRFFKDYDGAGNNKVLYTIKNLPAV